MRQISLGEGVRNKYRDPNARAQPHVSDPRIAGRGLRGRVFACQLPFSIISVLAAVMIHVFRPGLPGSPAIQLGLILHIVLLGVCFAVPWNRLFPGAVLVVPIADFFLIAFSGAVAAEVIAAWGLLAVFPVVWLSSSGLKLRTSAVLNFIGALTVVSASTFTPLGPPDLEELTMAALIPLAALALTLTIHFGQGSNLLQPRDVDTGSHKPPPESGAMTKRQLSAVFDTMATGVTVVDGNGTTLLINRQQRLIDERAGQDGNTSGGLRLVFDTGRPGPLPSAEHPLSRAARGESYSDYLLWVGADEDRRAVSATARAFSDPDDSAAGSVIVFTEVTDLVNALKARDGFISTLAHELQTPLTSILGHLDLVLEDTHGISPQSREHLHVGGSSAERLLALVSEILDTTSGSLATHPRPADMTVIIRTRVTSISAPAQKAGITLVQDLPGSLPASVDPLRIGQVLDNLISNAIKYSPDGGTVTVRAYKTAGCIQLEVEDQGIGISESEISQIFSKFFRSSTGTTKIPGTGLGLSIAKTIVENHHGTISCTSEPGTGTKFTIKLPNGLPPAHPGQDR